MEMTVDMVEKLRAESGKLKRTGDGRGGKAESGKAESGKLIAEMGRLKRWNLRTLRVGKLRVESGKLKSREGRWKGKEFKADSGNWERQW